MPLAGRRPIVCLVTDRRRLGPRDPEGVTALVDDVGAAARAGVDMVILRERDLAAAALLELAGRCVERTRGTATRVLVNERVDVALAAGASGVHLRSDSVDAPRVRRIVPPGFLVGRSVHGADEAVECAARGGLDYLLFGMVFRSPSKDAAIPAAGPDGLRRLTAAVSLPILAIGGVTRQTLPLMVGTGAAGVAAISLFAECGSGSEGFEERVGAAVYDIRRWFDAP